MSELSQQRFGLTSTPDGLSDPAAVSRLTDRRFGLSSTPGEFDSDDPGRITSQRFGLTMRLSEFEEPDEDSVLIWCYYSGLVNQIVGDEELIDMRKNTAGQTIGAQLISAADGTPFTGTVSVYITGDTGTQAIGTVGSGVCTHVGRGHHVYAPSQAETNFDRIGFTFEGSGAMNVTVQASTVVTFVVDDISTRIPLALVAPGYMSCVVATGGITSSSFANGAITPASIAADAIGSSALATTAVTEIAAAIVSGGPINTSGGAVSRVTLVDTTTNITNPPTFAGPTVVRFGTAFTSSAGTEVRFSAWLEADGEKVILTSGDECDIAVRENGSGTDLFTLSSTSPTAQGIFELTKATPGFTSDRLYIVTITIEDGDDIYETCHDLPVFG